MRACPFSPFSCSYMMNSPESRITRSVCVERHVGGFMRQRLHQFDKALQRRRGAAGQHFVLHQLARRLPQRQLTIARRLAHHVEVRSPMPRVGVLTTRSKAASSLRLEMRRR